jgi:hypothetical protein
MSLSQAHKELFGRLYHSIWNERRMEFIDLVIADTHALGDPTVAGGATGPSAYRRQVERFLTGLPDLKFDVHETISEGDKLVVYWTIAGTHLGEFLGVPATQAGFLQRNHDQPDPQQQNHRVHGHLGWSGPAGAVRH